MSGGGFARHMIEVFKANRALKTSARKTKQSAGKREDGKLPMKFGKANQATKARIQSDKAFLAKQMRFRIALLVTTLIFGILLLFLFLSFG